MSNRQDDLDVDDRGSGAGRIRAVDRVCDILDAVARRSNESAVGLAEIAEACNLPKTSAFRYLATLEARQYVERMGDVAEYRLGLAILNLRSGHFESLAALARPLLEQVRDEFDETTNLGVLSAGQVSYLSIVESRRTVRLAARPEDRDALHCTALGKAMIARLSDARIRELIGTTYERRTYRTITTWEALRGELERVKANGFALDDEENELGGRCIAVAIPGMLDAAVSLSAPTTRMGEREVERAARRLTEIAAEIGALAQSSHLVAT